jgi:predicted TIM-barrel fold metal-dependent hydrolase
MNAALMTQVLPAKQTDIPIFDVDVHWAEPADLWTSRAPAKYKDKVMHVRRAATGTQGWFIGDARIAPIGPAVIRPDLSKQYNSFSLPNYESMTRAATYTPERLEVMDALGVGTQVVYPNAIGFGAAKMISLGEDNDLRMFHIRAYNDAIADVQKESQGRLIGQMVLPLWDIAEAVKEMQRGRKLGLTGVSMTDQPQHWNQPLLSSPEWDPFWAACQELGAPVNFHIASGDWESAHIAKGFWGDQRFLLGDDELAFNGPLAAFQSTTLFMGNQTCVMNLILSGILDRFPKLKFVSVESGLSWVPFIIQSLELSFREVLSADERRRYKRSPREAFLDQVYVTYWFENKTSVDYYIDSMGSDNILFETDFPHPVSTYPGVQAVVHDTIGHLPDALQRKVLYGNAEKLYGIKVGKVRG